MSVSFEADIKLLFTQMDRDHMLGSFDLWGYDDVKAHAVEILKSVSPPNPFMPPADSGEPPWIDAQVARFKEWIDAGYPR